MNESWYEDRDKRTDSCTQVTADYKSATVQVYVTECINEYRVQLMTYLSLVMLAKWCRSIVFTAEKSKCLLSDGKTFAEFVEEQIKAIDPFCQFKNAPPQTISGNIRLYIGEPIETENKNYVSINGGGWTSVCSFNQRSQMNVGSTNIDVLGTCFAACLGNAALFRYLIGQNEKPYTKWYSLQHKEVYDSAIEDSNSEDLPSVFDFGRIHLIGCGAIGSSFCFLLPFLRINTQMLLVDPDHVEAHNTSSSLLFTYKDAADKKRKVDVCQQNLEGHGIKTTLLPNDYKKHKYTYNSNTINSPDITLCFANEHNIWSTIQQQYPPICFHATTSKSWGVHIGRHIPLKENCLMCTFKDVIDTKFTPECAVVNLNGTSSEEDDSTNTAILPFLAPAAAIITLSELIQLVLNGHDKENTTIFNMATADGQFVRDYEPFGKCYICSNQERLYPHLGKYSKYWNLSAP